MKTSLFKISASVLFVLLIWSCSKSDNNSVSTSASSLKDAVTASSQNLNNAMDAIVSSQAFQVFTLNANSFKSASTDITAATYTSNILLANVAGIYNYKPLNVKDAKGNPLIRFFQKSASTSGDMVVNVPLSKIQDPRRLRVYVPADSTLANNFSIEVSDYHNNYNNYHDFDYNLASSITIDAKKAGNLNIKSVVSPTAGANYASSFVFADSYTAKYLYTSGDTTVSSFTILKGTAVLYQEKLLTIKNDTAKFGREHQYTLTIGDVSIVRKSPTDVKVYLKGVLQAKAVVAVVDKESTTEPSACHKREIQITFEDGTVSTVSTLIGNSITNIASLFDSLHSVYFAAYVVDWIAYDIFYKR